MRCWSGRSGPEIDVGGGVEKGVVGGGVGPAMGSDGPSAMNVPLVSLVKSPERKSS